MSVDTFITHTMHEPNAEGHSTLNPTNEPRTCSFRARILMCHCNMQCRHNKPYGGGGNGEKLVMVVGDEATDVEM